MNIVYDTHLETDHLEVTIDDEFGYPKNLTNTPGNDRNQDF